MKMIFRLPAFLAVLTALFLSLSGCSKDDSLPYYQFLPDDRLWLTGKNGDTWVFESSTGKRARYQLYNVEERKETSVDVGFLSVKDRYYFDQYTARIARLDTMLLTLSDLQFRRGLPTGSSNKKPPKGAGECFIQPS